MIPQNEFAYKRAVRRPCKQVFAQRREEQTQSQRGQSAPTELPDSQTLALPVTSLHEKLFFKLMPQPLLRLTRLFRLLPQGKTACLAEPGDFRLLLTHESKRQTRLRGRRSRVTLESSK